MLERLDSRLKRAQSARSRHRVLPFAMWQGWPGAGVDPRLVDRMEYAGAPGDDDMVGYAEMARNHCRPADLAVASDPGAARDADAACNGRVRANDAVVPDLDLVVELD